MSKITLEIQNIKNLLEQEDESLLRDELNELHPADLAEVFNEISNEERATCFSLLSLENASDLLDELDVSLQTEIFSALNLDKVLEILELMPNDAVVDLLGFIPEDKAEQIIKKLPPKDSEEIRELMSYPEDTAGGIMTSEFLKLISDMTIEQTLEYLRLVAGAENISFYYLYVVDRSDVLVGVVGLRTLITSPPYITIEEIMDKDVTTVNVLDDQEIAANLMEKYDLLLLPVVDEEFKLKGVVTWDDARDVIEEEITEDIYSVSGIHVKDDIYVEEIIKGKLSTEIKARTPWLLMTLIAEFGAVAVANLFGETLNALPIIAIFMPLMTGLGGNTGTQSVTMIVRALYTGHITMADSLKYIFREFQSGMYIGTILGVIVFIIASMLKSSWLLGMIVGFSMFLTVTLGATVGTLVPFFLKKINLDPAVASGPIIATGIDVIGLAIYFTLTTLMLDYLPSTIM